MYHIGKEVYVEVGANKYRLSRYTRQLEDEFVKWALASLPDPIAQARQDVQGFPPELQKVIVQEAIEQKRRREAGILDELEDVRRSPKGIWKVLSLLFQKYNPELTERDVGNIFDECLEQYGPDYLSAKIQEASGSVKVSDLPAADDGKKKATLPSLGSESTPG